MREKNTKHSSKNFNLLVSLISIYFILFTVKCFSQGAAINTTGATANASAMLDVSSNNSGILIPRLTKVQRNGIILPAIGLMIYQVDDTTGFWYFNGNIWKQLSSDAGVGLAPGNNIGNTIYWDGLKWAVSPDIYNKSGSVGIGTNNPDVSSKMEVSSINSGFLIPRMTTTERNSIATPAVGLQIFNLDKKCFEFYDGNNWKILSCGCDLPPAPIAGSNIHGQTSIDWDWNDVSGAIGYQWNTINSYPGFGINATISSDYTQIGLSCNNSYTLYVWAYNYCGYSDVTTLTANTNVCCGAGINVTFNYRGTQVTYGTVSGSYNNGEYCWLDKNLGAITIATAYDHANGYGDLFQWGRLDDGHQVRTPLSGATSTLSNTDVPGHANFIYSASASPEDWRIGQNNNLWQGVSGINNPCPAGWRLPVEAESINELISWGPYGGSNYSGAIQCPLHLPATGERLPNNAILYAVGVRGLYWTSTIENDKARCLDFGSSNAYISTYVRGYGMSVRCIKDY